jgi:cytochrome bd ubiquinol oxidase subunit I
VLAGWITTEVGRQPFTVYGLLRTSDSLAPIAAPAVATSLVAFIVVYFFVFGAGLYYILRMMGLPPDTKHLGLREAPVRAAGITPAAQIHTGNVSGGHPEGRNAV